MSAAPTVDLVLIWHHHQPDYRSAVDRHALLPWVRLHAAKDYLDMARHVEHHPGVRVTFNLVPSLVDQLEDAVAGLPDRLFDLIARAPGSLTREERLELAGRCRSMPGWAVERWPEARRLVQLASRWVAGPAGAAGPNEAELTALSCWFLMGWIDPMFHGEPEAAAVLRHQGPPDAAHRDGLLALHARLTARVLPAYAALASRGQVELSVSPYYHPILPLVVDLRSARRARPDLPLPVEPFAAPEDGQIQIARALDRHALLFGARPAGVWPSEGSVSPEAAEIAAACGVRWLASDEGVLWRSLAESERRQEALFRPWRLDTAAGPISLFFRHHELSDRIGFVYQRWDPVAAVNDFLARLRRIGAEHKQGVPVVSVILDGENCWEGYADDGREFLDGLYRALAAAPDIHTRTPSDVLADPAATPGRLERLHSGSWINSDFRIWIGHPEKNRAWDLLARARRAVAERAATPADAPAAWESIYRAEGSDWFWWFGDDHFTLEKSIFDGLFREHLRAAYEAVGLPIPAVLQVPISTGAARRRLHQRPIGLVSPQVDGRRTQFFEWHGAGRVSLADGGGAMHRGTGLVRELYYGFDLERLYLRIDFAAAPPDGGVDLAVEIHEPRAQRILVEDIRRGAPPVALVAEGGEKRALPEASCRVDRVLELAVPFATLGLEPGDQVELLVQVLSEGRPSETVPGDELVRFAVPDATFERTMWGV